MSGPVIDRVRFWTRRHGLVQLQYQDDLAVVADVCQSFIFDNGAFTVWKKGGVLDTDGYYKWVETWNKHPSFDWALIPDVISGDEDQNDRLLEQWPSELKGVPVWHVHESVERLLRLSKAYSTVALGSSGDYSHPGSNLWWGRMAQVMNLVCDADGAPPCKFHGLRMLSPKVFTRLPLASADSTNAVVNAGSKGRFGIYLPVSAWQRAQIIADRVESHNSAPRWGAVGGSLAIDEFHD